MSRIEVLRATILQLIQFMVVLPDMVSVTAQDDGVVLLMMITVDPADVGLIVGKSGRTIRALRTLVMPIATKLHRSIQLNLQPSQDADEDAPSTEWI